MALEQCIYFISARCINMTNDNNLKADITAVLAGHEKVRLYTFLFFCLFIRLFNNKCYKKSETFKCKVATKILKSGLANSARLFLNL